MSPVSAHRTSPPSGAVLILSSSCLVRVTRLKLYLLQETAPAENMVKIALIIVTLDICFEVARYAKKLFS